MKKLLYLLLSMTLVISSCKSRKESKAEKTAEEVVESAVKKDEVDENTPKEVIYDEIEMKEQLAIISLSKSVCFGACPAFSVQIYKSGVVMYEGISDVDNVGQYKGIMNKSEIDKILSEASDIGFFALNDSYDNTNVTDVPTAITYINYLGKKKKVVCRFECDVRITKINKLIERYVSKVKLKQIEK